MIGLLAVFWQPAHAQKVSYIHTDALGSVVAITDQDRNVIERREYEPYGAQLTPVVQDGPGYTGHVQDAATGLVYMQQRYYDPGIGRFLSVDPVTAYEKPMTNFNRYAYAFNSPYNFTDPDGRDGVTFVGGVITESWNALNGRGFDGDTVIGALKDGYDGEGDGFAQAAFNDATTFVPAGAIAGGVIKLTRIARAAIHTERLANFSRLRTAATSAQQAYKGSTLIGHALSKHAGRNPGVWGRMSGSMRTWNTQAMRHFREIVRGPGRFQEVTNKDGTKFLEKTLRDGRGVRLNMDGTFKGFIDK
ncbi:RHS repeat-associated core domain-containing protein [Luteimonas sp. RD2P54]|uniref:RHS repeat-associated core domain-containing protein n=1 Tax=Luteimonas endophytica TaxID=3042023 RepID=A0ABT6JEN4_9GAMM|nr:RHS repeat-associated core domain-containing protein [Luteimonas endophytica]MDH5824653.1 RHS repeat-associated core domain-containing protein [Luteimonas endophytica]